MHPPGRPGCNGMHHHRSPSDNASDLSFMVHHHLEVMTFSELTCMMEASCMDCSPAGPVGPMPICAAGPAATASSLAEAACWRSPCTAWRSAAGEGWRPGVVPTCSWAGSEPCTIEPWCSNLCRQQCHCDVGSAECCRAGWCPGGAHMLLGWPGTLHHQGLELPRHCLCCQLLPLELQH